MIRCAAKVGLIHEATRLQLQDPAFLLRCFLRCRSAPTQAETPSCLSTAFAVALEETCC